MMAARAFSALMVLVSLAFFVLGLTMMVAGIALCLTVVGIVLGIPMFIFGWTFIVAGVGTLTTGGLVHPKVAR